MNTEGNYVVYAHCASGYREIWDIEHNLEAAKAVGVSALKASPVTDCGTGGILWVEIIGGDGFPVWPDDMDSPEYAEANDAWAEWEPTAMIGLSQDDLATGTDWQEA